jgi:hypothetical protein
MRYIIRPYGTFFVVVDTEAPRGQRRVELCAERRAAQERADSLNRRSKMEAQHITASHNGG